MNKDQLGEASRIALALAFIFAPIASATVDRAHIDSLNSLSRGYIFNNIEYAVTQYGQLADEARALSYRAGEARALQHQGVALYLNGQYEEGVKINLQAIRLFEELNLRRELAMAYGDLGYEMKRRDLTRATDFMQHGITIAEADQDSFSLCALYDNFGVLQEMADRLDRAAYYYRQALDYKTALNDSLGIPFSLTNLAGIATFEGRLEEAASLLQRSDAFRQAMADSYGLIQNSVQWGELFLAQGDLNEAAKRYQQTLQMPGIFENGYMVSRCYERLATVFDQMQDYERAYQNHLSYTAYRDSLSSVEINSRMAALEVEFDTEKKDRQLAENKLAMTTRSRQILGLLATVVVLVISGVSIVRYQHLKRSQLRQEMDWQVRLRRAEYEQKMTDEKLRISRELHDNIGAQLTFMTSSIDNISHQASHDDAKRDLNAISEFGRSTLSELRQTVWAMKSEGEGLAALVSKLRELKRQCGNTGRQLEFQTHLEPKAQPELSSGKLLNIFRIAQEAVQNSLKYTNEGVIEMHLTAEPDELVLLISDAGPGFNESDSTHVGGLANMRARCHESGGSFTLTSDSNGTEINCRFPVE